VVLALIWSSLSAAPLPDVKPPSAEDIAKAEKIVNEALAKLKATDPMVEVIKDESLGRTLPQYVFIHVWFRQYPVARVVPEGLQATNIFAVSRDGKVKLVKDAKGLEDFFKNAGLMIKTDDQAKDLARSWVRLSQELHQDGFFKFVLMDDSTKVADQNGVRSATAKIVVMAGGNGDLVATLQTDDQSGRLLKISETNKIRPGPRPICQATKLLDNDPIVRRMAEQDLLIMGKAARDYLLEQRAKAKPELQKAIDQLWKRIQEEDR